MSQESLNWLNTNTLIGFTEKRGKAWHWRAEEQDGRSNHYTGAIPVLDVQERLFHWQAESRPVAVEIVHDDVLSWEVIPDRQAIVRSDTQTVMGIFGPGYARHQYAEWLLTTVANLLDDDLAISSAGLLRGGAIAWVEVSMPETITTPEGVAFRPNLLSTTSFDGSIATTYKRTVTDVVCDNTRELALAEAGQEFKIRHSRHSRAQLGPAREALAMVHSLGEDFAAEISRLCATDVSPAVWGRFLDVYVPRVDPTGQPLAGRSLTLADNKRDALAAMYRSDPRVAPWAGTAHGVIQAVSTYEQHEGIVRGSGRAERNGLKTITGDFGKTDRMTWATLSSVLSKAA